MDGSHLHIYHFGGFGQCRGELKGRTVTCSVHVLGVGTYIVLLTFLQRSQFQAEVVSATFRFHPAVGFQRRGRGSAAPTDTFLRNLTPAIGSDTGIYGRFCLTYSGYFGDGDGGFVSTSQREQSGFAVECTVARHGISSGIV